MKNIVRSGLILSCLYFLWVSPSHSQEPQPPEICIKAYNETNLEKRESLFLECVEQSDLPGFKSLAYINLGSIAMRQNKDTKAIQYYDAAEAVVGGSVASDPSFHAYRSSAYVHVGRNADAIRDATQVFNLIQNGDIKNPQELRALLELILIPLQKGQDQTNFQKSLELFISLKDDDFYDYLNKASVLTELGRYEESLSLNAHAMALEPEHPAVLNNQCYILANLNRAVEALRFCEKARQISPDSGAILHSYAFALAKAGDCEKSEKILLKAQDAEPVVLLYKQPIECTTRD